MTMFPRVQAVSAPTVDADVLFDFNEHGVWYGTDTLAEGWTLGVPSRLAEAGAARTAWGPRRPEFSMRMRGDRATARRVQSELARWLLRPEGWVLFQLDNATAPVWLHMIGAEPQDLDFGLIDRNGERDIWDFSVSFDADPFLYGERVTLFDGTVPNDPTVAGGMVVPLGDVPGDAPMPLRVEIDAADELYGDALTGVDLALISLASTGEAPRLHVKSVGSGDGATGVHAQVSMVSGSAYAGGGARRIGFAAGSGATPVANQFTVSVPAVPDGVYRVLALARASASVAVSLSAQAGGRTTPEVAAAWTVLSDPLQRWVDLGEVSLPWGGRVAGSTSVANQPVTIRAGRWSGSGALDISAVALVPVRDAGGVDAISTLISTRNTFSAGGRLTFDAPTEQTWASTAALTVMSQRSAYGGWPTAAPGRQSAVAVVRGHSRGGAIDTLTMNPANEPSTVTISGHPQWLYLPNWEA